MKIEDAVKIVEFCLADINSDTELAKIQDFVIQKRIRLAIPMKREYKRKNEVI
jgi:hypothetical protein